MTWLVIAHASLCRIYQFNKKEKRIFFLQEFAHIQSRLKNANLVTDKPGHYQSSHVARGAFASHEKPKKIEMEVFARKIGKVIEMARKKHEIDELILIASPHMHGLIQENIRTDLLKLVAINKNYLSVPEHKLVETLLKELEK